jgi:four helix bundle protein
MKTHKDLKVWKDSMELVTLVYQKTKSFPNDEKFGLTSQIRRSAVSIPSNIAEGSAKNTDKDFIRYLYISLGSASELHTQLIIANNLDYLKTSEFESLSQNSESISKMISGLIRSVKNKIK